MIRSIIIDKRVSTLVIDTRKGSVHHVLVDTRDLPRVLQYTFGWIIKRSKNTCYVKCHCPGSGAASRRHMLLHRFILGAGDGKKVDHRDGDGLNNCRHNLRQVTPQQNMCNRTRVHPANISGFRGVSWDSSRGKWIAQSRTFGINHHLGRFDKAEDAGAVVSKFWKQYWKRQGKAA